MQILAIVLSDGHRQSVDLQLGRSAQTRLAGHAPVCTGSDQTHPNSGSASGCPEQMSTTIHNRKAIDQ